MELLAEILALDRAPFHRECAQSTLQQHVKLFGGQMYARYQPVVQSPGIGKSRMIDELSKEHLVIPINLRLGYSRGMTRKITCS